MALQIPSDASANVQAALRELDTKLERLATKSSGISREEFERTTAAARLAEAGWREAQARMSVVSADPLPEDLAELAALDAGSQDGLELVLVLPAADAELLGPTLGERGLGGQGFDGRECDRRRGASG